MTLTPLGDEQVAAVVEAGQTKRCALGCQLVARTEAASVEEDVRADVPVRIWRDAPKQFRNCAGSQHLIVGYGPPEPGESLSDRVRVNRTDEIKAPGCTSDGKQDRPIEVAGKHGILWSYTCAPDKSGVIPAPEAYYLSAQTISQRPGHRRVGYRFTVVVPLADKFKRNHRSTASGRAHLPEVSDATIDR